MRLSRGLALPNSAGFEFFHTSRGAISQSFVAASVTPFPGLTSFSPTLLYVGVLTAFGSNHALGLRLEKSRGGILT